MSSDSYLLFMHVSLTIHKSLRKPVSIQVCPPQRVYLSKLRGVKGYNESANITCSQQIFNIWRFTSINC